MNMKKVSLDTWIQLIGMLGILGGLVFVGLEMQQAHRIALASQQTVRAELFLDQVNSMTEAGVSFQDALMMSNGSQPIDSEYEAALDNAAHAAWWIYENDFIQYQLGLMDESVWQAKLNAMAFSYNFCINREVYDFRKGMLDPELIDLIEQFPDECADQ